MGTGLVGHVTHARRIARSLTPRSASDRPSLAPVCLMLTNIGPNIKHVYVRTPVHTTCDDRYYRRPHPHDASCCDANNTVVPVVRTALYTSGTVLYEPRPPARVARRGVSLLPSPGEQCGVAGAITVRKPRLFKAAGVGIVCAEHPAIHVQCLRWHRSAVACVDLRRRVPLHEEVGHALAQHARQKKKPW